MPHIDREKRLEWRKKYYHANLERERGRRYEYYLKHKPDYIKRARVWRNKNRTKYNAMSLAKQHAIRERNKIWLAGYMGMDMLSCERCGYSENFGSIDGHHSNPGHKKSRRDTLGGWLSCSQETLEKKLRESELVLLCRNCHQALHDGIWKIENLYKEENHG